MFPAIWRTVRQIPRGRVATYGHVAAAAGFEGASRQVVWALRAAKGPIPWHRVVGAGGRILLSGENALEQRTRLETEGVRFLGNRIDMDAHDYSFFANSTRQRSRHRA